MRSASIWDATTSSCLVCIHAEQPEIRRRERAHRDARAEVADDVVCAVTPQHFYAVGFGSETSRRPATKKYEGSSKLPGVSTRPTSAPITVTKRAARARAASFSRPLASSAPIKVHNQRAVVAAVGLSFDRRARCFGSQVLRGENIVEAPAHVSFPHVPPRCPPGEKRSVVRIEVSSDVPQCTSFKDSLDESALLGPLAYQTRVAQLGMDVIFCPGHV